MIEMQKLWGTAFKKNPSEKIIDYCSGYDAKPFPSLDSFLLPYEIKVNSAHAEMLCKQKLISKKELGKIKKAILKAEKLVQQGEFKIEEFEDSHSALEFFLTKETKAALKIHSGRSRNDLVATTTRLYLKEEGKQSVSSLKKLVKTMEEKSKEYWKMEMPGFSHHRLAVPYSYGKLLQSYAVALRRDVKCFEQFLETYDFSPLGACAGFGTLFPLDEEFTAKKLGFKKSFENSLDAVQQRWEAEASYCFCLAKTMNHLSQVAQTLTILSMPELNLIELPEEYCTGSSIMPHKKNPDVLEVTKAKAGISQSSLLQLLDSGKNSFTGYNRDSQWTKKAIIQAIEECKLAPELVMGVIQGAKPNEEKMLELSKECTQTAKAEKLSLEKGIPFRKAKEIIEEGLRK